MPYRPEICRFSRFASPTPCARALALAKALAKARGRSGRRRAFTLVETLAIIAVVSLLSALAYPAFVGARARAERGSCEYNVRQLALGVMQYAADYDDNLPPAAYATAPVATVAGSTVIDSTVTWPRLIQPYSRNAQILRCSTDPLSREISYGLNTAVFADLEDGRRRGRRLSQIAAPHQTIMLAENGAADNLLTPRPDTTKLVPPFPVGKIDDDQDSRPTARHMGTCVVGFMDGHTKPMPVTEFYGGAEAAEKFFVP